MDLIRSIPLFVAALAVPFETLARPPAQEHIPPVQRTDEFAGWWHDGGSLLLHISNRGLFGATFTEEPSAEWPAGSNHEHLYGAGLWVGGIVRADTNVTAGLFQLGEFFNHEMEGCGDPPEGICETAEGAPDGMRRFDDDGDSVKDEERLDGKDNDGDSLVDEDFAAISNEMFATEYYDSSTFFNQFFPDPADHHHPLGLHVTQETYVWSHPAVDDFVGVELTITNASRHVDDVGWTIEKPYVGMLVDADVGVDDEDLNYWNDDHAAFVDAEGAGTHVRMAYMFDENGGPDDVTSFLGVMLLDRDVHAFRRWSGGDQDPNDDLDRYEFLRGLGDDVQTIDPPTSVPNDHRFLISAGPFDDLAPDEAIVVRFAFVAGEMAADGRPDLANPFLAQRVYDGFSTDAAQVHWTASLPPPAPSTRLTAGNGAATIEWDDLVESAADPITGELDFAGYRVERAGPTRDGGHPAVGAWSVLAEWDAAELGSIDTGSLGLGRYRFVDRGLRNFARYFYRVSAVDREGFLGTAPESEVSPLPATTTAPPLIRVEPNPVRASVQGAADARVRFHNLPEAAAVRIYSIEGRLVAALAADPGAEVAWNPTGAGVFLYRISTPAGPVKEGRFVVLR
jgi:hypothetical protein